VKIIKWFKTLARIVRDYDNTCEGLEAGLIQAEAAAQQAINRANAAERVIRDRTDLSVDVSAHKNSPSTVIVTGRYKGMDYVQVFNVSHDSFGELVDQLREQNRFATTRYIDTVSPVVREVIDREVRRD